MSKLGVEMARNAWLIVPTRRLPPRANRGGCHHDGRTQHARDWFTTARRLLRWGQAHEALTGIEAALALEGLPDQAYQTLTNLYHYLDKHRNHIDYGKFKGPTDWQWHG